MILIPPAVLFMMKVIGRVCGCRKTAGTEKNHIIFSFGPEKCGMTSLLDDRKR